MKRTILVVVALACLVGCAHRKRAANDRAATQGVPMAAAEDMDAARASFSACLRERVPALDDGRSDVNTIAAAMRTTCEDQWSAYTTLLHQGRPPSLYGQIEKSAEDDRREQVLVVILEARERRKTAPSR